MQLLSNMLHQPPANPNTFEMEKRASMKCFVTLILLLSSPSLRVLSLGLQSGPGSGENTVAGGIVFDPSNNVVYASGTTDGSFLGIHHEARGR